MLIQTENGEIMANETILVVDDEKDIIELISYNLKKSGYRVLTALSGEEAITRTRSEIPDLIVLDLMLPGVDGLDVCRILKHDPETTHIPVIMVTAKGEETDVVSGLELGADDYICKPFSPKVLMARIRACLRKRVATDVDDADLIRRNELLIDTTRREVRINNQPLDLTYTEFQTLQFLARRPGWVFTRNQIIDAVRGDPYPVTERSVDVQVVGLRKKLGEYGKYIDTVRGVGYRFKEC